MPKRLIHTQVIYYHGQHNQQERWTDEGAREEEREREREKERERERERESLLGTLSKINV
jgi:hypothetical protein